MSDEESFPMGLGVEMSYELGDEISIPFLDLGVLEARLGHTFLDREYLERALTHPSYANERRGPRKHNQRLEFLGDSIIGMIVASELYKREAFVDEGMLTRNLSALVCEGALAAMARSLDLGAFLRLGKGEDSQGGRTRDSILCDAYEAVIAAVYVDAGYEVVNRIVLSLHQGSFDDIQRPKPGTPNFKGQLQSIAQAKYNTQPTYHIVGEKGPEHSKIFVAEVRIIGETMGEGEGRSKKQAEQNAAEQACRILMATLRVE